MRNIRFVLFCTCLFFSIGEGIAQVLFSEDFESIPVQNKVGDLPASWTLYNDNNRPSSTFSYCDKAWKIIEIGGENKKAVSTSWFTNSAARADRWMITPGIDLSEAVHPYLIFHAQAGDASDRDSYLVKVATAGVGKDDFTQTLLAVDEENYYGEKRAVSLEEYKGNTIYLAFILNSLYKYALYLDDITVLDLNTPLVSLSELLAPVIINPDSAINITAKGYVMSHMPVSSYRINYSLNGEAPVSHQLTGLAIANMESFPVEVPEFSLAEEGTYDLKLWLSHFNGIEDVQSDTLEKRIEVTNKAYYPRKSVLEIFSSSTCGPCAKASPFIKKAYTALNANTEETNLYVLKYQVQIPAPGDPAVTEEGLYFADYYAINAAPLGFLNGNSYIGEWRNMEDELPAMVESHLKDKTPFMLEARMERDQNHYKVEVDITNTGSYEGAVLRIAFLEDSIYHAPQSNGETEFHNIFRKSLPSPYGETLSFTESGVRTLSYEYTFDLEKPKIFNTLDRLSAIVYLQNYTTKEILQATFIPAIALTNAIDAVRPSEAQLAVSPNPCKDKCSLHLSISQGSELNIELFDLKGAKVKALPTQYYPAGDHSIDLFVDDLSSGYYFVKVTGKGSVYTKKVLVL